MKVGSGEKERERARREGRRKVGGAGRKDEAFGVERGEEKEGGKENKKISQ